MKDKKDLLGLLGLFTLISLLVSYYFYFQPKIALSQQTQKYTTFKTENAGFKFLRKTMAYFDFAPIFAQTPAITSPGTQVATKEYVDRIVTTNARSFYAFAKFQTTALLTDHFVDIVPFYLLLDRDTAYYIMFEGVGPEGIVAKNCKILPWFNCMSKVMLLTPFEFHTWRQAIPELTSIGYIVTVRGRTGGFEITFCQNLTGNRKLYWYVSSAFDLGGIRPASDYSKLRFAVDRNAGPNMAFIEVDGPFGYTLSCNLFAFPYSR